MARQQNTFEKLRREMEKKRKANEKMAKKRAKKDDGSPDEPETSEPAARRKSVRQMTDAEILRAARNA
ncbi:hypothetical protein [Botrimarina colliarenosi]|nr:hypothetical protein [Botrimarina colliarenosi]